MKTIQFTSVQHHFTRRNPPARLHVQPVMLLSGLFSPRSQPHVNQEIAKQQAVGARGLISRQLGAAQTFACSVLPLSVTIRSDLLTLIPANSNPAAKPWSDGSDGANGAVSAGINPETDLKALPPLRCQQLTSAPFLRLPKARIETPPQFSPVTPTEGPRTRGVNGDLIHQRKHISRV